MGAASRGTLKGIVDGDRLPGTSSMRTRALRVNLLVSGLSGIVAQIVLLRELLVSFSGNELTLGVILANWLILEAAGSYIAGKTPEKAKAKLAIYVLLQLCFAVAFPFAVYLARVIKNALIAAPGEAVGFLPIVCASFLVLLPAALPHGALFTYGSGNFSLLCGGEASAVGKVYAYDNVGSIAGGALISLLLIQRLASFEIAFSISLTTAAASVLLLLPGKSRACDPFSKTLRRLSIFLAALFACALFSPLSSELQLSSIKTQWRGLEVLHYENSVYGNVTVTRRGDQFTIFTDGIPSITTPVPDIASLEDVVHFSMLMHGNVETALIVSGGAGGLIGEILKYPVRRVDYVELDPLLLKMIERYSTPLTRSELSDARVRIHHTDGRLYLKRTRDRHDIIFIGLPAPQELQTNRFFSREFFSIAREKMNRDGILVLTLPGSLTYINPELRDLNGCITDTLKSVFRHVRIIPGDVNLYFASESAQLERITTKEMIERLAERKIATGQFSGAYIEHRLDERRLDWFARSMEKKAIHINSDYHPLGVFFTLTYWNALYSPYMVKMFKTVARADRKLLLISIAVSTLLAASITAQRPKALKHSISFAVFTSGFGGMVLDLAVIFTFQALYGYIYRQVGLLVAAFMGGVAFSGYSVTRSLDRIEKDALCFLAMELCFICFCVLLPFVFLFTARHLEKQAADTALFAIFITMSFLSGGLTGIEFPLAAKIRLGAVTGGEGIGHTAGSLYGADLLGGYFGGLIGGVLLLPVLGLKESCSILAAIKGSSFVFFLLYARKNRR
jgi:spermidine synthase